MNVVILVAVVLGAFNAGRVAEHWMETRAQAEAEQDA